MANNQHCTLSIFRLLALFCLLAVALPSQAQTIYALSGSELISFQAQTPGTLTSSVQITGLTAGQTLVGLDFRPATGQLYALGYNSTTGEARLYTINRTSGVATAVGAAAVTLSPNMGDIGFDFNPTVDRIRVTGSNNTNYRLHPVTGAIAATDGNLAFAGTDVNAGMNPSIGSVAYTNSYLGAPTTTLFNYNYTLNVFTTQVPPNNGTLNTLGASGITLSTGDPSADLDIYFDAASSTNRAFFVANVDATNNNDNLYTVNLTNGTVTLVGAIGRAVSDIAVLIERNVPATITGDLLYALTTGNSLISFDAAQPGIIRTLVAITGVAAGQVLSGLDFRPATGELYALGYNSATGEARLYTINLTTGAATAVGAAAITLATNLGKIGFDFNPVVDRIRVTSSSNANYRLHPVTGALAATDMNLAFAATDVNANANPSIGAVAYTNSFAGTTTTVLINYDDSLNVFTTQAPPNNGTLNTVGASGLTQNLTDASSDLDIFYDAGTGQNRAYFVSNGGTSITDNLYTVNLTTGATTLVGLIGNGTAVIDLAAFIATKPTITCPANFTDTTAVGSSSMVITYPVPTATTTCAAGGATVTLLSGPASGSTFGPGDTQVCYVVNDSCGNADTCCFTVTVFQPACDVKNIGCLRFEILSVSKDSVGNKVYRMRVTNNCTTGLNYVAFQVPSGINAVSPTNNTTYTAVSGRDYLVRSPNFSPYYSIRFKTVDSVGISGGQSDVFEYSLPQQTDVRYILVMAKLSDGTSYQAYANTFKCATQPFDPTITSQQRQDEGQLVELSSSLIVYPNPTTGQVFVDISAWSGQTVNLAVYNVTGRQVQRTELVATTEATVMQLPGNLTSGFYYLEMVTADGTRQVQRLVVQR